MLVIFCHSCTVGDLQAKIECLEKNNSKLQEEVCDDLKLISKRQSFLYIWCNNLVEIGNLVPINLVLLITRIKESKNSHVRKIMLRKLRQITFSQIQSKDALMVIGLR